MNVIDPKVLNWIAEELGKEITGSARTTFLRRLKTDPASIRLLIEEDVIVMVIQGIQAVDGGMCYIADKSNAAQQVVNHCKRFFADELANV